MPFRGFPLYFKTQLSMMNLCHGHERGICDDCLQHVHDTCNTHQTWWQLMTGNIGFFHQGYAYVRPHACIKWSMGKRHGFEGEDNNAGIQFRLLCLCLCSGAFMGDCFWDVEPEFHDFVWKSWNLSLRSQHGSQMASRQSLMRQPKNM